MMSLLHAVVDRVDGFADAWRSMYRILAESHCAHAGEPSLCQRVRFCVDTGLFCLLASLLPVHDSWSPPRELEEQELLRQRLENLQRLQDEETLNER